ncbi:F0F1 ATP synthase subunit delta [Falsihalocynthiibacter sp. S25ZX9]|uniref:F0F1 ATP synthase subunit B family protein n=1 Tax=Falsihalocynthiibacter sp. S25ZX9 TaxID=3240870 RepID=UPI003510B91D
MTIDFWGLGLQAVNVLILIWLLSRLFWRPVAGAIARRQDESQAIMDTAHATQDKADTALEEVTRARADIDAERDAVLAKASVEAETAAKAARSAARTKAEETLAAAQATIERNTEAARKANATQASDLSLDIAVKLLERLNSPTVQTAFLTLLIEAIEKISATDRAALVANPSGIEIITATDLGTEREALETAICDSLGGTPSLHFVTDPDLIAGLELRSAHFVLHNSWQADLARIRKAVKDAA